MIPWKLVELGSVAEIMRTVVDPSAVPAETRYIGLEHIERGGHIAAASTVGVEGLLSSKFVFTEKDVLYGKLRPYLAKISAPDFSGVCSTDIIPVRPSDQLDRRYLLHFLRQPSMVEFASSRAVGANLPRLSPKELEKFKVPLPPIREQRRVAAVLDQIDILRVKRREAISALEELTRSVFLDIFGDPSTNPKGWRVCSLGDLIISGPQNGLYKPASDYGTGVPIVRIDSFGNGVIRDAGSWKRVQVSAAEGQKYGLSAGDILVNRVNSREHLGKCILVPELPEVSLYESNMMRFAVDVSLVSPSYVVRFLQTEFARSQILKSAKDAVNQSSINQADVKNIQINIPPVEVCREFEQRQAEVESLRGVHERHLAVLDELFASIQQRALMGQLWEHEVA